MKYIYISKIYIYINNNICLFQASYGLQAFIASLQMQAFFGFVYLQSPDTAVLLLLLNVLDDFKLFAMTGLVQTANLERKSNVIKHFQELPQLQETCGTMLQ